MPAAGAMHRTDSVLRYDAMMSDMPDHVLFNVEKLVVSSENPNWQLPGDIRSKPSPSTVTGVPPTKIPDVGVSALIATCEDELHR